jgi:rod shape determining protein RodA
MARVMARRRDSNPFGPGSRSPFGEAVVKTNSRFRHLDPLVIAAPVALSALGVLMIYSATRNDIPGDPTYYLKRQIAFVMLGILAMIGTMFIDYRKLRDHAHILYAVVCGGLLLVLTPLGSSTRGAQAWFELPGGFQLQPSELAKLGLILAVAGYCYEHRGDLDAWRLTVAGGLAAVPIGLVMLQPDLGTAMVMVFAVLGILAMAGARPLHLLAVAAAAITVAIGVWNAGMLQDYQVDRLTVLVDENADPGGEAYNQNQSKISIGAGQAIGAGLFQGSQTQGQFVPEQHTDFIFTAVGEELGFLGGFTVLALFALFIWRMWRIAQDTSDFFAMLVTMGVLSMFTFQIFENIGMTMGIMPVTGIPLPFMSYGGSSTITSFVCLGLVANLSLRNYGITRPRGNAPNLTAVPSAAQPPPRIARRV